MANLNRVEIIGNVTKDPQPGETPSGQRWAEFDIAINAKDKQGNKVTQFVNGIICWDKTAEIAETYLKRGSLVYVEGSLRQEQWQDKKTGQNRTRLRVVAYNLQFFISGQQTGDGWRQQNMQQRQQPPKSQSRYFEDDIPY